MNGLSLSQILGTKTCSRVNADADKPTLAVLGGPWVLVQAVRDMIAAGLTDDEIRYRVAFVLDAERADEEQTDAEL